MFVDKKNNSNLFIKDISDLTNQTKEISGKNLYFADYNFNKKIVEDETIPNFQNTDFERFCENTFQFITIYKIDENKISNF